MKKYYKLLVCRIIFKIKVIKKQKFEICKYKKKLYKYNIVYFKRKGVSDQQILIKYKI